MDRVARFRIKRIQNSSMIIKAKKLPVMLGTQHHEFREVMYFAEWLFSVQEIAFEIFFRPPAESENMSGQTIDGLSPQDRKMHTKILHLPAGATRWGRLRHP